MAKKPLYSVGTRVTEETIQRLDKAVKDTETRSEIINRAVIYYLDSLETNEESAKNTLAALIEDEELVNQLAETVLQKLQTQTFTLQKSK